MQAQPSHGEIPHEDLAFFQRYRSDLFFVGAEYTSPTGAVVPIIYADSTAMGSPLRSIERQVGELLAAATPEDIDRAYQNTLRQLADFTNAGDEYAFVPVGSGCTGAMNLLFRDILCLRQPDYLIRYGILDYVPDSERPTFITTLMEHHSSDLVLRECFGKRLIHVGFDAQGLPDLAEMEQHLEALRAVGEKQVYLVCSGGSNVTGLQPDLYAIGALAERYGAFYVIDLAAAGPYTKIDLKQLPVQALGLSVHKFPGGPQTCGLLIVKRAVLARSCWQPPPPRISTKIELIRAGMVFVLKSQMSVDRIRRVVSFYSRYALDYLARNPAVEVLGHKEVSRFAIISIVVRAIYPSEQPPPPEHLPFLLERTYPDGSTHYFVHHNFISRLLSDIYGAQVRPGCSCAGAYGHWLLQIDPGLSQYHRDRIDQGLFDKKPGWIRITFNEMNTLRDVDTVLEAINHLSSHWTEYVSQYEQNLSTGEFLSRGSTLPTIAVADWQSLQDKAPQHGFSPAIEDFIQRRILPNAANTHTETSFTGTISTMWYHWAHDTILAAVGADERFVLKFVRAGYCWRNLLVYYLGGAMPSKLDNSDGWRTLIPEEHRPVFLLLPGAGERYLLSSFGDLVACAGIDEVMRRAAAHANRPRHALLKLSSDMDQTDFETAVRRLRGLVSTLIVDCTDIIPKVRVNLAQHDLDGLIINTEELPGGWQTHPVLILKSSLFYNEIPYDVGGGVVHWTTEQSQRYVQDRTALEDAGTPGIIQGIRTGLVIGRLMAGNA